MATTKLDLKQPNAFEKIATCELRSMVGALDHQRNLIEGELANRGVRSPAQHAFACHQPTWSAVIVSVVFLLSRLRMFAWLFKKVSPMKSAPCHEVEANFHVLLIKDHDSAPFKALKGFGV